MRNPELLIPASSLEVLKTAVIFGGDAVYIGGEAFGLRAKAKNFSMEDMEKEHVKAVFSVEERMTLFTLTYPVAKNFKWRPLFKYIFSTVKKSEKKTEGLR